MVHGLGSQIHLLSLAASYAEQEGRALLVMDQDEWWFTDPGPQGVSQTPQEDCPSRAWACHMKALSSCSADESDLGRGYSSVTALRLGSSDHLRLTEQLQQSSGNEHFAQNTLDAKEKLRVLHAGYGELRDNLDNAAHRNRRPKDWQVQGIPLVWWRAVLVS